MFLTHHVTWSVNSVCHTFGKRKFETNDRSRCKVKCSYLEKIVSEMNFRLKHLSLACRCPGLLCQEVLQARDILLWIASVGSTVGSVVDKVGFDGDMTCLCLRCNLLGMRERY